MNKQEFLNAICGKAVKVMIEGIEVEIRSLTVLETQKLTSFKDELEASMQAIILGLVSPQLETGDVEYLKKAQPGFVFKLAREISKISGLVEDGESPTLGN